MNTQNPFEPRRLSSATEIAREGYARQARGSLSGVFELLSPDIEIVQTTDLPWGGTFKGHEGARQFFARIAEYTDATPQPLRYVPAGEDVAVIGRLVGTVRANARAIDIDIVHVWTVRNGKAVRFLPFIDTPAMRRALGLAG